MSERAVKYRGLIAGTGAREIAIAKAMKAGGDVSIVAVGATRNPGMEAVADEVATCDQEDWPFIKDLAVSKEIDLATVGPEAFLDTPLVDQLIAAGIPTAAPGQQAAKIETSKSYLRWLMEQHNIPGQVPYRHFTNFQVYRRYMKRTKRPKALKPDSLSGGKDVRVMGIHLHTLAEAIDYGEEVFKRPSGKGGIVVEEVLEGQEFTLQAFMQTSDDGEVTVVPTPLVRDYKYAYEGDKGPLTGSKGSISYADGLLPYVDLKKLIHSTEIIRQVGRALYQEGFPYNGVIYGQFMDTKRGVRVTEFNARLGGPEGINVLEVLKTNLFDIYLAITSGRLADLDIQFEPVATCIKYLVPIGYPEKPQPGVIRIDHPMVESLGVSVYPDAVTGKDGVYYTGTSRAIALLAKGNTPKDASDKIESVAPYVNGDFEMRHDIGTY